MLRVRGLQHDSFESVTQQRHIEVHQQPNAQL